MNKLALQEEREVELHRLPAVESRAAGRYTKTLKQTDTQLAHEACESLKSSASCACPSQA